MKKEQVISVGRQAEALRLLARIIARSYVHDKKKQGEVGSMAAVEAKGTIHGSGIKEIKPGV
jgi:hypothetical protein